MIIFLVHTLTVAFIGLKTNNVEKRVVVLVRSTKHFVIGEPSMEKERESMKLLTLFSLFSLLQKLTSRLRRIGISSRDLPVLREVRIFP